MARCSVGMASLASWKTRMASWTASVMRLPVRMPVALLPPLPPARWRDRPAAAQPLPCAAQAGPACALVHSHCANCKGVVSLITRYQACASRVSGTQPGVGRLVHDGLGTLADDLPARQARLP